MVICIDTSEIIPDGAALFLISTSLVSLEIQYEAEVNK